ncbi:hypothetical protein [Paraflavitalea pollutisoli]|uniref:hypothetical protein n=1 Tax=Paraflavitalea pollutisoli TaxID=3034143 RepID=UPI0023ECAD38|nr:hypothetical protein [Paraflavitalea sp. H1-2-19X]
MKTIRIIVCSWLMCCLFQSAAFTQTITGAWKGKSGGLRTELKLVKKGDSLVDTAYYYTSKNHYRRYAVRGYFDGQTNNVVWWDETLLEDKLTGKGITPLLAVADFNCPGEDKMLLDGSSTDRDHKEIPTGPVALEKITHPTFTDEWDFVIDNYTVGANHPDIIDSIARLSYAPTPVDMELTATSIAMVAPDRRPKPAVTVAAPTPITIVPPVVASREPEITAPKPVGKPLTPEDKFTSRTNKLQTVIPVTAPRIELRFYDNAQVDGDSIALFLNKKLIFKNIRLTDQPYTIFIEASELDNDNELVMVAENLGSIPPNTSFMVAIVGKKRYEARLHADENSSALIRLIKQKDDGQ